MAWRWPGDKPLSDPMNVVLLTLICASVSLKKNVTHVRVVPSAEATLIVLTRGIHGKEL